jgi:hypothetical protein
MPPRSLDAPLGIRRCGRERRSPLPRRPIPRTAVVKPWRKLRNLELLGTASSASEGVVSDTEMQLTPAYRPGQLLETVPGLIVTLHSGEGKANQYLLRGYNLDHGTDLETYVDGIPVNQVTHAHGQGYTDMNFLVPELADGLTYTKGPYYANVGDFGAVGSVRVGLRDTIADQFSVTPAHSTFSATSPPARRPSARETCWPPPSFSTTTGRSPIRTMHARKMSSAL